MLLPQVLNRLSRHLRLGRRVEFQHLLSSDQLLAQIERERSRADRIDDEFCLLSFAPREAASELETLRQLVAILSRRLRSTDHVGWLPDYRVGVVLPSTPTAGAWKVADDVCLSFPYDATPPVCTVYNYPADWLAGGDSGRKEEERPAETRPVHALDSFFVRQMPLWKRALDVTGALVGLVLLAPLFALVALAIRIASPGPVLFRQERSGLGGARFWMYKFRSMYVDAEARKHEIADLNEQDGPAFKIKNDPRVTPLGKLLRMTSIDELPQLWNVLRGDMSLVGPRPLPCSETAGCNRWHLRRLQVTPGLTCVWQVRGRSQVSFEEWVRMDVEYVNSRTLIHDLKLLVQTVPAVALRRGAS
jgi:lipopolysaccharide/colanic/teichoic acid biosynthesis glycosyltransferase